MIKPIKKFFVQISPIKFIDCGKPPKNDIASVNKANVFLEKIPPQDEFLQISIGEVQDLCNNKRCKKSED